MPFIGYLLGTEPGGEGSARAAAVHVRLSRVARPRGPVWLVLMCAPPPHTVPCAFWGRLRVALGSRRVQRERGQSWGDALVPQRCRRLCWGSCDGGDPLGYWGAPSRAGTPTQGQQTGLGALGCALAVARTHRLPRVCVSRSLPLPSCPPPAEGRTLIPPNTNLYSPRPGLVDICPQLTIALRPNYSHSAWL